MYNIAEISIHYKPSKLFVECKSASSSYASYNVLKQDWEHLYYKESFKILLLNTAHNIMGISKIGEGGTASVEVDAKIIFQTALKANASFIICAHNHPTGNLKPSKCDLNLTRQLVQAGKFLSIEVLDHLILGHDSYYSFADNGLI